MISQHVSTERSRSCWLAEYVKCDNRKIFNNKLWSTAILFRHSCVVFRKSWKHYQVNKILSCAELSVMSYVISNANLCWSTIPVTIIIVLKSALTPLSKVWENCLFCVWYDRIHFINVICICRINVVTVEASCITCSRIRCGWIYDPHTETCLLYTSRCV